MALFDIKLFSTTLLTNTDIRVVVPTPDEPFAPDSTPYYKDGVKYQVLYLLHGAHGDCTVWTRNTGIERYAQQHKLIVVSASVTNSCYMDMKHGLKFMTYMTVELPKFINAMFPVSTKREDTFIAGMSMGGYGAYRVALQDPERFGAAASLSGGLELAEGRNTPGAPNSIDMSTIFGDDEEMRKENDIFTLIEKAQKEGKQLPKFYQCCGTEDFLYESNQRAKARLEALGVDHTYDEGPGIHNWDYWDPELRKILDTWLPCKNKLLEA